MEEKAEAAAKLQGKPGALVQVADEDEDTEKEEARKKAIIKIQRTLSDKIINRIDRKDTSLAERVTDFEDEDGNFSTKGMHYIA